MNPCKTAAKRTKATVVFLISTLSLYIPNAFAAGGEMPSLVHDIGISLLTAGVLAILFTKLKIPSIAAFLVAGILIGPIGLKLGKIFPEFFQFLRGQSNMKLTQSISKDDLQHFLSRFSSSRRPSDLLPTIELGGSRNCLPGYQPAYARDG